jgi:hypothetical protein
MINEDKTKKKNFSVVLKHYKRLDNVLVQKHFQRNKKEQLDFFNT